MANGLTLVSKGLKGRKFRERMTGSCVKRENREKRHEKWTAVLV